MNVLVREHDVSSTCLEVILKGFPKDNLKISEFDGKFKPELEKVEGIESAHIDESSRNINAALLIQTSKGIERRSVSSGIQRALRTALDLPVSIEYRGSDPIDYL